MATATRYNKSKAVDTRALNVQPNNWPEALVVTVFLEGEEVGPVEAIQGKKLSPNGAVTYKGAIAGGWELEGEPTETLRQLSFVSNGVDLKIGAEGVHQAESGNPTVFLSGVVELKPFSGQAVRYSVRVRATYVVKDEAYCLHVESWPAPVGAPRGPQVVGRVGAGFVLRPRPAKAA